MKRKIITICVFIMALVILCSTLCSCGLLTVAVAGAALSDGEKTTEEVVNNGVTTAPIKASPVKTSPKTVFNVGETYTIRNKGTITYTNCEMGWESGNMFIEPANGNVYVKLDFEFENTQSKEIYFSYDFDCYADGYKCNRCYYVDNDLYI